MSAREYVCDCNAIHMEHVERALEKMPRELQLEKLAALYKLLGDSTRVKILFLLDQHEMCVCDIAYALGISKSLVSHQLKLLRERDMVRSRREGREVYYAMSDAHVTAVFEAGLAHAAEHEGGEPT